MPAIAGSSAALYSSLGDDPELGEIVELFVEEMPDRVATLVGCYDRGDWEGLGRAAHQLKGAAGSYGFEPITPAADRLEAAVGGREPEDEIHAALDELVALCERVRAGARRS